MDKYVALIDKWFHQWLLYQEDSQTTPAPSRVSDELSPLLYDLIKADPDFIKSRLIKNEEEINLAEMAYIMGHVRSSGTINHETPDQLSRLLRIGIRLLREGYLDRHFNASIFILDQIFDTFWHQSSADNVSDETKALYATLTLEILKEEHRQHWIDSQHTSASNFNHCIYFIIVSSERYRDGDFEKVYEKLGFYLDKYKDKDFLTKYWFDRNQQFAG